MEPSFHQRPELIAWYLLVCTHAQEAREAMRMQEECSDLPAQRGSIPISGPYQRAWRRSRALGAGVHRASKRSSNAEGESSITRLIPIDEAGEREEQTHGRPSFSSNEKTDTSPCLSPIDAHAANRQAGKGQADGRAFQGRRLLADMWFAGRRISQASI